MEMTGKTPSGTPVRLSHAYVADQFWKMSNEIDRVAGTVSNLFGMESVTAELYVARDHWRAIATKIEKDAGKRAASRAAVELERAMQD